MKVLFYFTQAVTGSADALVPMWMRQWRLIHHLLFDTSDILREDGYAQMGAVIMFMLYSLATNLPIVKQCTPEWKAICTTIQNKCSKVDSKLTANVMYLANEAEKHINVPTRHHLTKSEIRERILVDMRCIQ